MAVKYCKFCDEHVELPDVGVSSDHWCWDKNKLSKVGGYFRCRHQLYSKNAKWDKDNIDKVRAKRRRAFNKYRSSTRGRLRSTISARISVMLKNNSGSKLDMLDWNIQQLKEHLESKFQPGMSWDNYGKWHIDHIIPDSWFDYSSADDSGFKASWSLNNLQPLWAKDNLSKNNNYVGGC